MNRRDKKRAKVQYMKALKAQNHNGTRQVNREVSLFDSVFSRLSASSVRTSQIYNSPYCKG